MCRANKSLSLILSLGLNKLFYNLLLFYCFILEFSAPHVCSEFYTDWLLTWGENHGNFRPPETIVDNLSYLYHEKNASVNLYLVHGGTNFEFNNGAEYYAAVFYSTYF
jgi:hypothetical protein